MMKVFIYAIVFTSMLLSCSSSRETSEEKGNNGFAIDIHFDVQRRHCGGTPPPQDYVNGIKTDPLANQKFYIKSGKENGEEVKIITSFTTDNNGNASVNLPAGIYCIIIPEKTKDFSEFYEKQSQTKDSETKAESITCFKEWFQKCDGELKVNSAGKYSFTIKEHCGYGFNPCMHYDGPPRP